MKQEIEDRKRAQLERMKSSEYQQKLRDQANAYWKRKARREGWECSINTTKTGEDETD
ncbi:hypothetical protein [Prevotella sp. kh1p2]|uniref:hypothetical protein n=1 Tax=Prevotella sp. kh1p2 TaxID=1761883 RepID=UPI0008D13A2F|nr:hypothetical protein [Prevotella sp. kh1p2]SET22228.1 hypothetical protein SAMN04487825_12150 [Prevotella sp. kh1p2]SNU12296.1 hypothetical protein SAMN06298210_12214 [Prevotellaceae bacterium KH2P17]